MIRISTFRLFVAASLTLLESLYLPAKSLLKTMRRLPDSGQTQSFTNTVGEDADYLFNQPYFIVNGDGTVTDTVTGLMWQQTDGGEMAYENAAIYCADLLLGAYTDWRLPTAQEAFSILNHGKSNPALDLSVFANTSLQNQPARAWYMETRFGVVTYDLKTARNHLLCVRGNGTEAPVPAVLHGEILGRPTDQSVTVQILFAEAAEVCVRYGTQSGNPHLQTSWQFFQAGVPAEIVLDNLSADTRYYYRIGYRAPGATNFSERPERRFHTQRAPGSAFTFVIQADPHLDNLSDTALYRRCLENQLADQPDFMVDLGDIFMSDKMKNAQNQITPDTVTYRVRYLRNFYESICHSAPLFIALGNHEGEAGWQLNGTANNVAVYGTNDRKKYFLNPAPDGFYTGDNTNHPFVGLRENYYAWHWGDALFIVLDPYWYTALKPDSLTGWRWTLGKDQYDWLKNILETSTASFKFVFAHQLVGGNVDGRGGIEFADLYEWGGKNLNGTDGWNANRPGWYKPIKDLLPENRVTIFFHGHDHFFGKQEKDCLVYQETPQPSHPNFSNAGQADDYGYFTGQILPNSGHLRVTVGPQEVITEYVRAYLPQNETPARKNRDVSALYFIGKENCYDSLSTGAPVLWNTNYTDELIYPNPSAGEVKIEFSLAQPTHLDLAIFNQNGVLVRQLIAGEKIPEGKFQIIWDGLDANGNVLPNGVYFWQIKNPLGAGEVKKIVILR
ncbi:MAG: DUF1566 domain-containing protein [Saprospiraceae bacterium]